MTDPSKKMKHIDVTGMDIQGYGEAHQEGRLLKIPGAASGDIVSVSIVHQSPHKSVAWCEVNEVHSRGAVFQAPPCGHAWPVNGRCGGCPLLHVRPVEAASIKCKHVEGCLADVGVDAAVHWHGAATALGYRNRGNFVVARKNKKVILGAFAPRSHDVVLMTGCPVLQAPISRLADEIADICDASSYPIYPEEDGLRYVTIRADETGAVLVDVVVAQERGYLRPLCEAIRRLDGVRGISFSINNTSGNAVRVSPSLPVWGDSRIIETVDDLFLQLGISSFSQLNRDVMRTMYRLANVLVLGELSVIWDLYSGVGGLGLTVASRRGPTQLYGTDFVESAIKWARLNAQRAKVEAIFEPTDLSRTFPKRWPKPDLVLLNPPRRGIDPIVKDGIIDLLPPQLIYMSCNPASFAKDVRQFVDSGYRLDDVHAFDMLPSTSHVEVIASLFLGR